MQRRSELNLKSETNPRPSVCCATVRLGVHEHLASPGTRSRGHPERIGSLPVLPNARRVSGVGCDDRRCVTSPWSGRGCAR